MSRNILWLASYPKSGNTWLRLFLFNYLFDPEKPAPINQAYRVGPSDAVATLYRKVAKGDVDLSVARTSLKLRNQVIRAHSSNGADVNFMKTHNSNMEAHGRRLIPPNLTRGAIYIIRNPFDMAVSFAHHYNSDMDDVAKAIGNPAHIVSPDPSVVHQFIGNWSDHVRSWTENASFDCHVLRYEDMADDPETAFGGALRFLGAPDEGEKLRKAIRFSNFDEAKKQEREFGFVERSLGSTKFFRSGRVGEGREVLPSSAIDRIISEHGDVMEKHGYL